LKARVVGKTPENLATIFAPSRTTKARGAAAKAGTETNEPARMK